MAIHPLWTDDYWLLIMQLYQKSPAGVKSEYSRSMVELALELHIPPKTLQEQMEALKERTTPARGDKNRCNAYGTRTPTTHAAWRAT